MQTLAALLRYLEDVLDVEVAIVRDEGGFTRYHHPRLKDDIAVGVYREAAQI